MYLFPLSANDILALYRNKTVVFNTNLDSCPTQEGEAYYMLNANVYDSRHGINSLSVRIIQLLSAIDRKLFDKIWPPKSKEKHKVKK